MAKAYEVNFDGLVGPTHNYAGLSFGNVASAKSRDDNSNPKEAALQGLTKMRLLSDMGIKQAVLPPHERPHLKTLRKLGFVGSDEEIIRQASREEPEIFASVVSASSMWTANAASISPSADTRDGKVHITVANLENKFHRSIEAETTDRILSEIFKGDAFKIHEALPNGANFGDEGAANHTRLCTSYGDPGLEIFTYGRYSLSTSRLAKIKPIKYPGRQTFEASSSIARSHQLNPEKTIFAQQGPHAIDQGVFHNDVISVGNGNVFLYHEMSFVTTSKVIREIENRFEAEMHFIKVKSDNLTVRESVGCYLFNSQLVTLPKLEDSQGENDMALIAPIECNESKKVRDLISSIIEDDNPIKKVHYINLKQSMRNGGGPACLRLRVALTKSELKSINQGVILTDDLYHSLREWVMKHYREELTREDLCDPQLYEENKRALDELTQLLKLGSIYDFQK